MEPATFPDHDAIFFLHEEGDRWRITLTGPGYPGLSPTEESHVIGAIHVIRVLRFDKARVVAVEIHRTQ